MRTKSARRMKTNRMRRLAMAAGALALLLTIGLWTGAASAENETPESSRMETICRQLMNPCENCGGKPLSGSYCGPASEAKDEVRFMIDRGMSDDEIIAAFRAEYGDWILSAPEKKGFNLVGYFLPVVGLVLGGAGLTLFLRRATRKGAPSKPEPEPEEVSESGGEPRLAAFGSSTGDSDPYRSRLQRELASLDR